MERENLAPRGPGCVLSDGLGGGWWLRPVGEGQPEVVGATSCLARKGNKASLEPGSQSNCRYLCPFP